MRASHFFLFIRLLLLLATLRLSHRISTYSTVGHAVLHIYRPVILRFSLCGSSHGPSHHSDRYGS